MLLEKFNGATDAEANALVKPCLDITRWVTAVVDARPYGSVDDVKAAALSLAAPFTEAELDASLAHHPRIGERAKGDGAEASMARNEQSGVSSSAAEALADGNREYEQKFNRVFLIRAAGRDAEEILSTLRARLNSSPEEELVEIEAQLREIAALRLGGALQ